MTSPTNERCAETKAPNGWYCQRIIGHEGPCAANTMILPRGTPTDKGPHVRYLIFGWLGILYGMVMAENVTIGHDPAVSSLMLFGAMPISLIAAAIAQSRWHKKRKP